MAGALEDVSKALFTKFATLNKTYVAYPNGPTINAPAGQTVYELHIKYSDGTPTAVGPDATNRYYGFLQVNVLSPADGLGDSRAKSEAQEVVTLFKRGTTCVKNGINVRCKTPDITTLKTANPAWYCLVVTVPWWADIPN